ncbi:unnamed protein product [marine sediment metagenome]|uniref:Uncharacterized protein n=1 Tax=marine sediment metagenome TaxID=412755 RepID=X0XVG6_9ZZZZ
MAEYHDESIAIVAKEITLVAMEKLQMPGDRTAKVIGDLYGKLYKTILKHVKEAIIDEVYD